MSSSLLHDASLHMNSNHAGGVNINTKAKFLRKGKERSVKVPTH